jgi:VanZ family protein
VILPVDAQAVRNAERRRFVIRAVSSASYGAFLLFMGLIRTGVIPKTGFRATDKILHAVVFGGLAILVYRLLILIWPKKKILWHATTAIVFSTIFGILLELLQLMTAYRSAEFADVVADFIGALLFTLLAVAFHWERPNRVFLS